MKRVNGTHWAGSTVWESMVGESTGSPCSFWIWEPTHWTGCLQSGSLLSGSLQSHPTDFGSGDPLIVLGACSLGVSVSPHRFWIWGPTHWTGILQSGSLLSGSLQSRSTDLGFGLGIHSLDWESAVGTGRSTAYHVICLCTTACRVLLSGHYRVPHYFVVPQPRAASLCQAAVIFWGHYCASRPVETILPRYGVDVVVPRKLPPHIHLPSEASASLLLTSGSLQLRSAYPCLVGALPHIALFLLDTTAYRVILPCPFSGTPSMVW